MNSGEYPPRCNECGDYVASTGPCETCRARLAEAFDTRWILRLDLTNSEKLCLLTLWSLAEWRPRDGSPDYRVSVYTGELAEMLGMASGTVSCLLVSLRRKGWVRRCTYCILAHILERCDARVPPPRQTYGHVYLAAFSDGRIKVGLSWNPKQRIKQHASDARRAGMCIVDSWVSPSVDDVTRTETQVLARIERNGGVRVGKTREYFTGLDFSRAVVLASATCVPVVRP
jgi:hypothetical protein